MYKYLLKSLLSVLLGIYSEVELLDHIVILCLTFLGITILFSTATVPFYIPTSKAQQHLLFSVLFYFKIVVLVDAKWLSFYY